MARISQRRRALERRKLGVVLLAAVCVVMLGLVIAEIAMDRWPQASDRRGLLTGPGTEIRTVVTAEERQRHEAEMARQAQQRERHEAERRAMAEARRQREQQAAVEEDKIEAWVIAEQLVKQSLRSPATASFGSFWRGDFQDPQNCVVQAPDGSYVVFGWVDAQNAFGATVRSDFRCRLRKSGDGAWDCLGLQITSR